MDAIREAIQPVEQALIAARSYVPYMQLERRQPAPYVIKQLRNVALMERHGGLFFDAITAGYGFELEESDVLAESRHRLDHPDDGPGDMNDPITIRLDELPLLAYPSTRFISDGRTR